MRPAFALLRLGIATVWMGACWALFALLALVAALVGAICGIAVRLFTLPARLMERWR